jgi:GT2 family glycosyltransferase
VDHPLGACFAVRREAIDQVGLLDEGFFLYCEEIDWAFRIHQAGWPIYYVPAAEVIHYGGQSTRQFRSKTFVELHRSRFRLFQKHCSSLYVWAARRIVHLGLAAEMHKARQAAARGEIDARELAERLEAYREVARL